MKYTQNDYAQNRTLQHITISSCIVTNNVAIYTFIDQHQIIFMITNLSKFYRCLCSRETH